MKKRTLSVTLIFAPLCLVLLLSCARSPRNALLDHLARTPAKNLDSYSFDPSSSVISRLTLAPDFVIAYLKEMDNVDTYSPYYPTDAEIAVIESYLELLPPLHRETLQERLVAIYFINDFIGSGMADYVIDDKYNIYSTLILNPQTLRNDITAWTNYRENTCFINDRDSVRIQIDCGDAYLGLMYILLHETTHIVDYVHGFTPYVEENMKFINSEGFAESTPYTEPIWKEYKTPIDKYNRDFRSEIIFYGLGGGPRLNRSSAKAIYRQLKQLPFASLYGSMSWAEDYAEMVTWYHFTEMLKQPYRISVYDGTEPVEEFAPMELKNVQKRHSTLQVLYE